MSWWCSGPTSPGWGDGGFDFFAGIGYIVWAGGPSGVHQILGLGG